MSDQDKRTVLIILDDLRVSAEKLREQGDSIARTVDAMSITGDYQDNTWQVHMSLRKFNQIFADQGVSLVEYGHAEYPFKKSITIGGMEFYCILSVKELTEEESKKWITDRLNKKREET